MKTVAIVSDIPGDARDRPDWEYIGPDEDVWRRLKDIGAQTAVFFTRGDPKAHLKSAIDTKKAFPNIEIIFSGPATDMEATIRALKGKLIDLIVRVGDENLLHEKLKDHREGRDAAGTFVLWRDSEGIIQWRKPSLMDGSEKKVLLVLMPAWNNHFPPFGLAHISAALRAEGHRVDVLDLNWLFWERMRDRFGDCSEFGNFLMWRKRGRYEKEAQPHLKEIFETLRAKLRSGNYGYAGFSIFETSVNASFDAFDLIREFDPSIKIFSGGPSALLDGPFEGERLLSEGRLDAIVVGEGEASAVELLAMWKAGEDREVAGVHKRSREGEIRRAKNRPLANINALPHPDFTDFHVYNYDKFKLPVYFSRGCVAQCTFCAETKFWVRFRVLSPENVVAMINRAVDQFGIRMFQFNDSLLNGSHKHLEKFVDLVIEKDLKIKYHGYCRLESDLTPELLSKMGRSGCIELAFGMESASQKVTELMNKEVDVRHYAPIIKAAHKAGIGSTVCVIVGFPGEGWRDFFKTAATIMKLGKFINELNLSVLTLQQMAKSAKEMAEYGIHPKSIEVDEWETIDGKNTPRVRMIRFWLLQALWKWKSRKRLAPSWIYRPA